MVLVFGCSGIKTNLDMGNHSPRGERFKIGGIFTAQCFDAKGNLKWEATTHNLVTTAGLNATNDIMFHASTQVTTWYIGLIDETGTETLAAGDTLASHAGWTENTEYGTPAARGEWTEGASSGGVITNGTSVDFTMNDSGTLVGLFLCSVSSGTSGTLFSEAAFTGGNRTYVATDIIKVTYTLTGADA